MRHAAQMTKSIETKSAHDPAPIIDTSFKIILKMACRWLNFVWNRVDETRVEAVGPNRFAETPTIHQALGRTAIKYRFIFPSIVILFCSVAAEWIIRLGGQGANRGQSLPFCMHFPVLLDHHGTDTWNATYGSLEASQLVLGIDARGSDVTDDGLERLLR